jgi:hypothetical protein
MGPSLGMSKAEIRSKFDEIVDFSGVGNYIDTPGKEIFIRDVCAFGICGSGAFGTRNI